MASERAITLTVTEPTEDHVKSFYERFDGIIHHSAGRHTVLAYTESRDGALETAQHVVMVLEAIGFKVTGVDRELVNISDIADRVGRSRQSVRQLVTGQRGQGHFPLPVGSPGGVRVWTWSEVASWFRANEQGFEDELRLTPEQASRLEVWLFERKMPSQVTAGQTPALNLEALTLNVMLVGAAAWSGAAASSGQLKNSLSRYELPDVADKDLV
jgi:hypothetical protein